MDFSAIYDIISSNPIYIAISALLVILLIYSIIKKFVKVLMLTLIGIVIYVCYLYFYVEDPGTKAEIERGKDIIEQGFDKLNEITK